MVTTEFEGKSATTAATAQRRPGALPRWDDRAASDLRRFDLALGVDLAAAVALTVILSVRVLAGAPPSGRDLAAWSALLGLVWGVVAGGIALHRAARTAAATRLLTLLAGPVAVIGLALAPVAVFALSAAASSPSAFRDWVGAELPERLRSWAAILSFLLALLPASLLTRRFGRHVLGYGIALGAVAMISLVLFGIAGGFLFRSAP
jgi:hypothetical protein